MRLPATANRKNSLMKLAPLSIAFDSESGRTRARFAGSFSGGGLGSPNTAGGGVGLIEETVPKSAGNIAFFSVAFFVI